MDKNEKNGWHIAYVSNDDLEKLSQKTIFFGHRSVGYNILEGISDIQGEHNNTNLKIVECKEIELANRFYHVGVGQNGDPFSKIQDFARMIDGGIGEKADIAFFKLCYVDFRNNTDVYEVFKKYKQTMEKLKASYPDVCFIHVTTPLVVREKGVKNIIKGLLGRSRRGYEDNIIREKFNRLMRNEYGHTGLVFDLARLESTSPDGRRVKNMHEGEDYYSLVPVYSNNGGHLNETGRRYIADNLLIFLAAID